MRQASTPDSCQEAITTTTTKTEKILPGIKNERLVLGAGWKFMLFSPFSDVGWFDVNKHREIGTKPNVMLLLHCVLARSDKLRSFFFFAGSSPGWHV